MDFMGFFYGFIVVAVIISIISIIAGQRDKKLNQQITNTTIQTTPANYISNETYPSVSSVVDKSMCNKCKTTIREGALFCPECGLKTGGHG